MKNLLFISLVLMTVACGAQKDSEANAEYNPQIHVLGSEEDWKTLRRNILFNKVFEIPTLQSPAGARGQAWDAESVLHSMHTWFTEGAGYVKVNYGQARLLYLRPIPLQVLFELESRLSSTPTGFGLLDIDHWRKLKQLQLQKFKIAVIAEYQSPIAGFNISSQRWIAFDILANSGTLAHEARHQKQFDQLGKKAIWNDVSPTCKGKLSEYFAELDATTTQLPEWVKVIRNAKINVENLVQFEEDGGRLMAPTLLPALSANLEYPISQALLVLGDGQSTSANYWEEIEDCSKEIKDIVREILEVNMRQKKQLVSSIHAQILKGKLRVETANLLSARLTCGEAQGEDCTRINKQLSDIGDRVARAKEITAQLLESAYAERLRLVPALFMRLSHREIEELCNEVMGAKLMLNCESVK